MLPCCPHFSVSLEYYGSFDICWPYIYLYHTMYYITPLTHAAEKVLWEMSSSPKFFAENTFSFLWFNFSLVCHTGMEVNNVCISFILFCFCCSRHLNTPLLERCKCWGKSILPRAGYRLDAYSTLDIFNFSHFSLTILEKLRFLRF